LVSEKKSFQKKSSIIITQSSYITKKPSFGKPVFFPEIFRLLAVGQLLIALLEVPLRADKLVFFFGDPNKRL
jgi:hypothetical protein